MEVNVKTNYRVTCATDQVAEQLFFFCSFLCCPKVYKSDFLISQTKGKDIRKQNPNLKFMNYKKATSVLFIFISSINLYAQNLDYFIENKDTTFCQDLKYSTWPQGSLRVVEYTDLSGKPKTIKGGQNLINIITLGIDSAIIDKTPLKANKPDGRYFRFTERAVNGKLIVYLSRQGYIYGATPETSGPSGIYRFYLKLPDGTYYKINSSKNLNKYIKPYLLKCTEFKNQYKGDYSTREQSFMEMIRLYNSLCE